MGSERLRALVKKQGKLHLYEKDEIFYSLDFKEELYVVGKGYVTRNAITGEQSRVIESIYGPDYFFPLTPVYKTLLDLNLHQSQENNKYVYQALTNVEIQGISIEALRQAVEDDPSLYKDLMYEAGHRLKANIDRLASNALKNDYKKVTHQFVCLAEEFGKIVRNEHKQALKIPFPLRPSHMAEQLNISPELTEAITNQLEHLGLIRLRKDSVLVPDIDLLKDAYLQSAGATTL